MISNEFKFSLTLGDCIFHIRSREKRALPYSEMQFDIPISGTPETAGLHKHYFMEIQYVFSGEMEVTTNGTKDFCAKMGAGDLCLIPPGLYHSTNPTGRPVRFGFTLSLEYNRSQVTGQSDFQHFSKIFGSIDDILIINDELINTYMRHSNEVANSTLFHTTSYQGAIILAVILRLAELQYKRAELQSTPTYAYTPQEYDRRWIIENFLARCHSSDATIDLLAKELYLSNRQTRTVVKKVMGDDFKNLIIKQRIDLANILMENTDLSLEEIAAHVGYNSYSSFYTAYVKLMGVSPNKHKNRNKKKAY